MFPKPQPSIAPNTYALESCPLVKPTGFREYDARWLFEKEINLMGVQALGLGIGTLVHEMGVRPDIVTGHDFRGYSSSIKYAGVCSRSATSTRRREFDEFGEPTTSTTSDSRAISRTATCRLVVA